jgi:hypothetical protein
MRADLSAGPPETDADREEADSLVETDGPAGLELLFPELCKRNSCAESVSSQWKSTPPLEA